MLIIFIIKKKYKKFVQWKEVKHLLLLLLLIDSNIIDFFFLRKNKR